MLIKVMNQKVNFIDENDVFVGYDLAEKCCENANWYFGDKKDTGKRIDRRDDIPAQQQINVEGYVFDTAYFFKSKDKDPEVQFRLIKKGCKHIYLNLFNVHNGYYEHGFNAQKGVEKWVAGRL